MTGTEASTHSPQDQRPDRHWRSSVPMVFLFFLIVVALYIAMLVVPPSYWLLGVRVLIIVLGSALPLLIYTYFIQGRGRILYREYQQNLRRLGYPDVAQQYREKFEAIYGRINLRGGEPSHQADLEAGETIGVRDINLRPMNSPIAVAVLFTFLGWVLVFYPVFDLTTTALIPSPTPIVYGFLGAYVFSLGALVRQYVTDDLQPRYYASLTLRYITVFALSWLIVLIMQVPPVEISNPSASLIPLSQSDQALIVAFFIGMFPATGLRLIQRSVTVILGVAFTAFKEDHPLSMLEGMNAYQEDRLHLEGIENLQNLACANIVDLMLKTRFPVEQIVDWIDQALLCLHTGAHLEGFRRAGLRTATDFLDAYDATDLPKNSSAAEWSDRRQQLAALISSGQRPPAPAVDKTLPLFDALAIAMRSDPNMFHIRYWRAHAFEALPEDIERMRISADLQLMQGLYDEAIEIYNNLLRDFPTYPSVLLYRGLAHFSRKEYAEAIADYTEALTRGGKQWINARYAYVARGRALRQLEDYDQAVMNYQTALQEYANFPEAQMELAFVQMTRLNQYDEAIANLDGVIAANFKEAEACANRGVARYERWKFQNRPPEKREAELGQARVDLERALRLKPELTLFYVNLALIQRELGQLDAQEQTLTRALQQLEATPAPDVAYRVRLERGYLYQQRGHHDKAAADFEAATRIFDQQPAAYVFLGTAQFNGGNAALAEETLQHAVALDADLASAYLQLGEVHLAQDKSKEAEDVFSLALRLTRASGDLAGQVRAHLGLARSYRQQSRWQDARREANNAAQEGRGVDDLRYTDATYEIGLADAALGRAAEAAKSFLNCAVVYETLGYPRQSAQSYYQLSLTESDHERPQAYLEKALAVLDTVFDPRLVEDVKLRAAIQQARAQLTP